MANVLISNWPEIRESGISFGAWFFVSITLFILAVLVSGVLWVLVLQSLGVTVRGRVLKLLLVHVDSWTARYIPGVGSIGAKLMSANRLSIPKSRIFASSVYENLFLQLSSYLIGLTVYFSPLAFALPFLTGESNFWLVLVLFPVGLLLMPVAANLINKSVSRIDFPMLNFGTSIYLASVFTVPRVLNGVAVATISLGMGQQLEINQLAVVGAAFVVAGAIGILAVFTPSGLGVREAVFIALVIPTGLSPVQAVSLAAVARIITTLSDLVLVGGRLVTGHLVKRGVDGE